MAKTSSCTKIKCGITVDGTVAKCPTCGSRMRASSGVRIIGFLMLLIGVLFSGAFGAILAAAPQTMLDPAAAIANHSASGTIEELVAIRWMFISFIGTGLVFLFFGQRLFQTGKPIRHLNLYCLVALMPVFWTAYNAYQLMPQVGH
jgi:hypothetical protein